MKKDAKRIDREVILAEGGVKCRFLVSSSEVPKRYDSPRFIDSEEVPFQEVLIEAQSGKSIVLFVAVSKMTNYIAILPRALEIKK